MHPKDTKPPIYVYSVINGEQEEIGELKEFTQEMAVGEDLDIGGVKFPKGDEYTMKISTKKGYNKLLWQLGMKSWFDYKPNNWRKLHGIPMRRRKPRERPIAFEITASPEMFTYQKDKGMIFLLNERTSYEIDIPLSQLYEG